MIIDIKRGRWNIHRILQMMTMILMIQIEAKGGKWKMRSELHLNAAVEWILLKT